MPNISFEKGAHSATPHAPLCEGGVSNNSMMKSNANKAVIFDMDGLILDTQRMATNAWKRAVQDFGFILTDELNLKLIGRNISDSNAILTKELGNEFPVTDCRKHAMEIYSDDILNNGIPIKPGLLQLLAFLEATSTNFALATSTPRDLAIQRLELTKLIDRFQIVITGDEIENGKPAPDIFLKASSGLETPQSNCIVLEDSFAGIEAAHNAKMIPIMVPDLLEPNDEIMSLAYAVVPSLNEAKIEIEKLIIAE